MKLGRFYPEMIARGLRKRFISVSEISLTGYPDENTMPEVADWVYKENREEQ